jgi:hypothetical protein
MRSKWMQEGCRDGLCKEQRMNEGPCMSGQKLLTSCLWVWVWVWVCWGRVGVSFKLLKGNAAARLRRLRLSHPSPIIDHPYPRSYSRVPSQSAPHSQSRLPFLFVDRPRLCNIYQLMTQFLSSQYSPPTIISYMIPISIAPCTHIWPRHLFSDPGSITFNPSPCDVQPPHVPLLHSSRVTFRPSPLTASSLALDM